MTEDNTQEKVEGLEKDLTLKVIYSRLAAAFGKDAVQRTKKEDTKKGYDTTGIDYQFLVDRFNEVMGISKWGWKYEVLRAEPEKWGNGRPYYDITVEVRIWILVDDEQFSHTCVGGHQASPHADALKGAITNAFKKTAAFFGVGAEAYRGTIDDDNKPPESGPGGSGTGSAPSTGPSTSSGRGSGRAGGVEYKTVEEFEARIKLIKNSYEGHNWMKKHQKEIGALSKADRGKVMKAYLERLRQLKGAAKDGGNK